ncbi:MAG: hypothetical protein QWI73_06745 [Alphaproteobacteria bacterium]|nr:hypothetical protein [Alphaproteobacteria bacterium]
MLNPETHLKLLSLPNSAGHFTYQCRNFFKVNPTKEDIVLDVSSTSSEEEEEEDLLRANGLPLPRTNPLVHIHAVDELRDEHAVEASGRTAEARLKREAKKKKAKKAKKEKRRAIRKKREEERERQKEDRKRVKEAAR